MDTALTPAEREQRCRSRAILLVSLAPVAPQILGSLFNIFYNATIIEPLLRTPEMEQRFIHTVIGFNVIVYPLAIAWWLRVVWQLRGPFRRLCAGGAVDDDELAIARRRLIHLPWRGALVSGVAWLLCIPVFLIALGTVGTGLDAQLLWHLPTSFLVAAFIAVTHSFFLIELASHRGLYPVFFRDARADRMTGVFAVSLRTRGILWAVSAGICPIGSLLLLSFAPAAPGMTPWFAAFVGTVGIAFGLATAILISRLVSEPIEQLRLAAQAVAEGRLDVEVPLRRADEFGLLIGEFNRMIVELREKERLRRTFGLHVGRQAAEQILSRDPGLNGTEEVVTVMFVDIRGFTSRSAGRPPQEVVAGLNEFLGAMVHVVETDHAGMINKFLGDGFMALFGVGGAPGHAPGHADEALRAARAMQTALVALNARSTARGQAEVGIGIGLHSGPVVVGSIGSPERLEYTAIGSTVNLASRVESLTKSLGEPLLLTDATRALLREPVPLRDLGPQPVRGISAPVTLFAPE